MKKGKFRPILKIILHNAGEFIEAKIMIVKLCS